jgi:hypothetical protein
MVRNTEVKFNKFNVDRIYNFVSSSKKYYKRLLLGLFLPFVTTTITISIIIIIIIVTITMSSNNLLINDETGTQQLEKKNGIAKNT